MGERNYKEGGEEKDGRTVGKEKERTKDESRSRTIAHAGLPKALEIHINIRGKEVEKAAHSYLFLFSFRSGGSRMGQVVSGDENSHPKSASTAITHTDYHGFLQQVLLGKPASASVQVSSVIYPSLSTQNSRAYEPIGLRDQYIHGPIYVCVCVLFINMKLIFTAGHGSRVV
jgi:hypothetical protein